ncbi:MAG: sensor histidine kinase [Mariprofundaceae bacterium]
MTSLSRHLSIALTLSLVCVFLFQSILVGIEMRKLTEDGVVSRLQDDMEGILAALSVQPGEMPEINWEHIPAIFTRPLSGHYFQLRQEQLTLIRSRSLWDIKLDIDTDGIKHAVIGPKNQQLIILTRDFSVRGQHIVLSVAEDTSQLKATSLYFQKRLLALSVGALLILLIIQLWVIRRGLKPLNGLRKELQQLEAGEIEKLEQPVPSEIQPLVEEVNRLLMVLQMRLQRSRNATGNLSHALKTPLTLIFQMLDQRKDDHQYHQLLEQAQRIESQINTQLSRARTAGQAVGSSWQEPEQDISDLAATLERIHQQRISIALEFSGIIHIKADREDMMELIGNLIDNACKWAESEVKFTLQQQAGLQLVVEDDGPGMTVKEQSLALGRGIRLDESKQGHGLGLSIVGEIIEAYNGKLELGKSDHLGGLQVKVSFPASMR